MQIPSDFVYKEINTDTFKLASWQKITNPTENVKIYIEGDGAAFTAEGRPSRNPTPKGTLLREIAFGDKHDNVVYLARPCQFVDDSKCVQKYWTTARFAPEVITAEAQAVRNISAGKGVTLVGFSGGAQIAGLVAVREPDISVKKLVTIGGNLDHRAWTTYHHLPPLKESLNLASYKDIYGKFVQKHYVGEKDEIILPFLVKDFVSNNAVVVVKGASHNKGWNSAYEIIRAE